MRMSHARLWAVRTLPNVRYVSGWGFLGKNNTGRKVVFRLVLSDPIAHIVLVMRIVTYICSDRCARSANSARCACYTRCARFARLLVVLSVLDGPIVPVM